MDIVSSRFHNRDSFLGCGILSHQRVPPIVEFPVDFATEQCSVFCPLTRVFDTVAAYAHAFEFVVSRVKDVVTDIDFLVSHDLCGSEIDEWSCHNKLTMKLKILYI